jgi:2-keto-3-deoxy-L-rhamnonate aldolase RhmA
LGLILSSDTRALQQVCTYGCQGVRPLGPSTNPSALANCSSRKAHRKIEDKVVVQAMEEAEDAMENLASDIASQLDLTGGQLVD